MLQKLKSLFNKKPSLDMQPAETDLDLKDSKLFHNDTELLSHIKSLDRAHVVSGRMKLLHGFGYRIGQVEMDS